MTDLLAAIGLIASIFAVVWLVAKVLELFDTVRSLRQEQKWQEQNMNSELQNLTRMWVGHEDRLKVLEGSKEKPDELL